MNMFDNKNKESKDVAEPIAENNYEQASALQSLINRKELSNVNLGGNKEAEKNKSFIKMNYPNTKVDVDMATLELANKTVTEKMTEFKGKAKEMELHNAVIARCIVGDKDAQQQIKFKIRQILEDSKIGNPSNMDKLVEHIYRHTYGLGAIDDLVSDDSINEIWVNGYNHIWVEKGGFKTRVKDLKFTSDEEVIRVMRQMLQYDKKEINPQEPSVESKLLDGSRLTFTIPPLSYKPCMNIRKFKAFELSEKNLLEKKTISQEMIDWLKLAIKGRINILVIGETGSGKTSFLKFMCDYISPKLRLGTIETCFELKLSEKYPDRNIFEYEAHAELERNLGALFKLCLRSSPDIIILGEARDSLETEMLISAMRRGHPGSIGTIHTNSPETAIPDLMDMILEDGKKRDPIQLKHRIAGAIELIIQIHRFEDTGERKVVKMTEVIPSMKELGEYELNDIFDYDVADRDFKKTSSIQGQPLLKKLAFFGLSKEELAQL